jgi:hypothetical protein
VAETLPEPRTREAHEHVRRLRDELYAIRAEQPGTGYALDAYVRYMRDASRLGFNPTALPHQSPYEADRFFSRVIDGPDRHRYWTKQDLRFTRNDGRTVFARRWWWEHEHRVELTARDDLALTCDDQRCIAPWHSKAVGRGFARLRYSDEQMLGGLQVEAMRLGHAPTLPEWEASGRKPSYSNYGLRFGSWGNALRAAGLQLAPRQIKRQK